MLSVRERQDILRGDGRSRREIEMTLRLSPKQLDIINWLKVPGTTPESYAKVHFQSETTIRVQLARVRAKDREARVFRATLNGLIGHYPQLRQWLKIPYDGQPEPNLLPKDKATVERRLQNPNDLQASVSRQGQKGRSGYHASVRRGKGNTIQRKSVNKPRKGSKR